jgi:hypothetical protein
MGREGAVDADDERLLLAPSAAGGKRNASCNEQVPHRGSP